MRDAVRARFPKIDCVFMTGHADEVLAPRGILREQVELLHKPFTVEALVRRIRGVLDEAQRRRRA